MGIDLKASGRNKRRHRTGTPSSNPYIQLLVKLYRYLARRSPCPFNNAILKRLLMSNINRPPMGLRRLAMFMKGKEGMTAVIVGTITDDERLLDVPAMNVCALRFTESARARIENAGGACLTFDQLAMQKPSGSKCVLLRGARVTREAVKHFGVPGAKGSHAKPYVRSKGRKFERARHTH
uniref:60S ribosomal protein L18-3 n=1 Tax=Stygiella incarcerata TaxID=1712417 RepID=A0A192ZIP5_9EUKA|nr:60S ribosomal protein L18-3 [Stygiella incarcerata]|eukprot:TRINITY_DN898_c0_g1_i2.p2 TRINITY_DN898_c0_g1~~TRINITY_DN898_c0_g1_i2.p2  ORF type:complete len:180 (-),score=52.01 TRINITY_DN898_c0_g1_i2:133-672(-)